ncbi:uncharacterized protein LOC122851137, partial [Aphidius gifuensis]
MAFQLDDLLRDDKRDGNLIPDLSKATCNTQEEFRRLRERCPEYKIKPEKVKRDDVKVRDKDFSWKTTKKELKSVERDWGYGDPVPPDMITLNLQELQQVAIDWRMLTPLRPKLRLDEEMFSRLVEMGKLEMKTLAKERRVITSPIRRNKNRAGIIESSVKICGECGEEYCFGESCGDILYDSFTRIVINQQQKKNKISNDTSTIIAGLNNVHNKNNKNKNNKRKNHKKITRCKIIGSSAKKNVGLLGKSHKSKCNKSKKTVVINEDQNQYEDIEIK